MICKNSYTSHVSGMLAGLLVGFYVLRIKGGEGSLCRSLDLFRRRLCPVIMAALVAFCVAKNIWGADYPAEDYCPLGLGVRGGVGPIVTGGNRILSSTDTLVVHRTRELTHILLTAPQDSQVSGIKGLMTKRTTELSSRDCISSMQP